MERQGKDFIYEVIHFALGCLFCAALVGTCIYLEHRLLEAGDVDASIAYALKKILHAGVIVPIFTAVLLFVDLVTPGKYLKKIEESSDACAYVACAIILGTAYILCYG